MKKMKVVLLIACVALVSGGMVIAEESKIECESPPIAVDGYCMVSPIVPGVWVKGEADIYSDYEGQRYLFLSEEEKIAFEAAPREYAPALGGLDVVASIDEDKKVKGVQGFAVRLNNRTYLFSSDKNIETFLAHADHYMEQTEIREVLNAKIRKHESKRGKSAVELNIRN